MTSQKRSVLCLAAMLAILLPSMAYAANGGRARVVLHGSVNATVTEFINAIAKKQANTSTIILTSDAEAAVTAGKALVVHNFHLVLPQGLKTGAYQVKGFLYRNSYPGKVAVSYICEAMTNAAKHPGCAGYVGHAKGSFTLTKVGASLSGHFAFRLANGAGARHVRVTGSFTDLPVR